MSYASAAETANTYAQITRTSAALIAREHDWAAELIDAHVQQALSGEPLKNGDDGIRLPSTVTAASLREVTFVAQDEAVRRLWARNRIVYDIDADLWAELGETDDDTIIPAGLFARLPHIDPFVAVPEMILGSPPLQPGDQPVRMRFGGFYVAGCARGRTLGSTHSPNATGDLRLAMYSAVETLDGRPVMVYPDLPDMSINRVTLDAGDAGDVRMGDLLAGIFGRFNWAPYGAGDRESITTMIRRAVSALIYLCATNADLAPLPARTGTRRRPGFRTGKPVRVVQVGYNVGAALRAWRRRESADAPAAPGGGTPKRPHLRRAHFHTYRVGPGRRDTVVKWLAPIPINATGDKPDRATVVPVRAQEVSR